MADFKDLIALYCQKFNLGQLQAEEVIKIINKITKLKLDKSTLIIKDNLAYLKIKPKEKLEIILNKNKILTKFKEEKLKITDLK